MPLRIRSCSARQAKARERGVKILEEMDVTGIRLEGDLVVAMDTTSGPINARLVVNAWGPWATRVAEMVVTRVPIYSRCRHRFVTEPFRDFVNPSPLVIDGTSGFYCLTEGCSILMNPADAPANRGIQSDDRLEYGRKRRAQSGSTRPSARARRHHERMGWTASADTGRARHHQLSPRNRRLTVRCRILRS